MCNPADRSVHPIRGHASDDLVRAGEDFTASGRVAKALTCFDAALALDPFDPRVHRGRGRALYALRRPHEAQRSLQAAAHLGADPDALAQELWMCAMLLGEFEQAWQVSDAVLARREAAAFNPTDKPFHLRPVWRGTPLSGRHVLVRCYHGLGDTIQFIRYMPLLRQKAASVTIQAVPALHNLLRTVPGIDRIVPLAYDAPDPPFEIDIELMEVPYALRTRLATIPAAVPYLTVDATRIGAARQRIAVEDGLKVGLAWAAGEWRRERSLPLDLAARLGAVPGVALVNLQRGPALAALEGARVRPTFIDPPAAWSDDIVETAATIRGLDLVISVDTMVAHLAGALGAPVWTLLDHRADWRWMLDRADSPWYPTMRLFRQKAPGDWMSVVMDASDALGALVAVNSPSAS